MHCNILPEYNVFYVLGFYDLVASNVISGWLLTSDLWRQLDTAHYQYGDSPADGAVIVNNMVV